MAIVDPVILAQTAGIALANPYPTNYQPLDIAPLIQMQNLRQNEQLMDIRKQEMDERALERERQRQERELARISSVRDQITGIEFLPKDAEKKDQIFRPVYEAINRNADPTVIAKLTFDAINNPETQRLVREKERYDEMARLASMGHSRLGPNYSAFIQDMEGYATGNLESMPDLPSYVYVPVDETLESQLTKFAPGTPKDVVENYVRNYYKNPIVQKQLEHQRRDPQQAADSFLESYLPSMEHLKQFQPTETKTGSKTTTTYPVLNVGTDSSGRPLLSTEQRQSISNRIGKGQLSEAKSDVLNHLGTNPQFQSAMIQRTMESANEDLVITIGTGQDSETLTGQQALNAWEALNSGGYDWGGEVFKATNPSLSLSDGSRKLTLKGTMTSDTGGPARSFSIDLGDANKLIEGSEYPEMEITGIPTVGPEGVLAGGIREIIAGADGVETNQRSAINSGFSSSYDTIYGNDISLAPQNREGFGKPLTQMTVDEVIKYQDDIRPEMRKKYGENTSAAGAYQIVGQTLKSLRDEDPSLGAKTFTPELQNELFMRLLRRRGFDEFLRGNPTPKEVSKFVDELTKEWTGLENRRTELVRLINTALSTPADAGTPGPVPNMSTPGIYDLPGQRVTNSILDNYR